MPHSLISPYRYSGLVRQVFLNAKYRKKEFVLINSLVDYLIPFHEQFNLHTLSDYVATFVPGDSERIKKRGFSLSQIICNSLSRNLAIEYFSALRKKESTIPLSKQNKYQRKRLVKNRYELVVKRVPKKILLVDDIFTTGSTLLENTRILKRSGVKNVVCFALAYRPLDKIASRLS